MTEFVESVPDCLVFKFEEIEKEIKSKISPAASGEEEGSEAK